MYTSSRYKANTQARLATQVCGKVVRTDVCQATIQVGIAKECVCDTNARRISDTVPQTGRARSCLGATELFWSDRDIMKGTKGNHFNGQKRLIY